jgi:flagellar biosynthetic protein FlhB
MADEDDSEKTEEPSHKKLEDAREKGQVPSSKEGNHWIIFLAATIFLLGLAPPLAEDVSRNMVAFLERPHQFSITSQTMPIIIGDALSALGLAIAPTAALFVVAAAAAGLLQTGFIFSAESITPKLEKISPIAGVKRLFSLKSLT